MNHIFKKIWSKTLGRMVVVSENARSLGKTDNTQGQVTAQSKHDALEGKEHQSQPTYKIKALVVATLMLSGQVSWAENTGVDGGDTGGSDAISGAFVSGLNSISTGSSAVAVGNSIYNSTNALSRTPALTFGNDNFIYSIGGVNVVSTATSWIDLWANPNKLTSINGNSNLTLAQKQAFLNASSYQGNRAVGNYSLAIGTANTASGYYSSTLGVANTASEFGSSALGLGNKTLYVGDVAIGQGNFVNSLKLYRYASATGMGVQNYAYNHNASAVGTHNTSLGANSVAVGSGTASTNAINTSSGLQLGNRTPIFTQNANVVNTIDGVAVTTTAIDWADLKINPSKLIAVNGVALNTEEATAFISSLAFGGNTALATNSNVFGIQSMSVAENATALGFNSLADEANTVSVGRSGEEKRITNVANATKATDAVNLQQVQSLVASSGGVAPSDNYDHHTNDTALGSASGTAHSVTYDDPSTPTKIVQVSGINVTATSTNLDDITSFTANGVVVTDTAQVADFINAAKKGGNIAVGLSSTAVGVQNLASAKNSSALGYANTATQTQSSAIGALNYVSGEGSSAIGSASSVVNRTVLNNPSSLIPNAIGLLFENNNGKLLEIDGIKVETTATNFAEVMNNPEVLTSIAGNSNLSSAEKQSFIQSILKGANYVVGKANNAVGNQNIVMAESSSALGFDNIVLGKNNNAVGSGNFVQGQSSNAIGSNNTTSSTSLQANAIGANNSVNGSWSNAIGTQNTASAQSSSAFGLSNKASANESVAFGSKNIATGTQSNAIGSKNTTTGTQSNAIGSNNTALGQGSSAMGGNSAAITALGSWELNARTPPIEFNNGVVAKIDGIDVESTATNWSDLKSNPNKLTSINGIALDSQSQASVINSLKAGGNIALGKSSNAVGTQNIAAADNSSVFGVASIATAKNATAIGYNSVANEENTISVGKSGAEKRITNVANGINDNDAVNYGQLKLKADQSLLTALDGRVTTNEVAISTLQTDLVAVQTDVTALDGRVHQNEQILANLDAFVIDSAEQIAVNRQSLTNALGGGAGFNNGVFVAPSYHIQGQVLRDVGSAFGAVDQVLSQFDTRISGLESLPLAAPGLSAYEVAKNNGFTGTETDWLATLKGDQGEQGIQGIKGDKGDKGNRGLSAYEVAVENGYTGTEADWVRKGSGSGPYVSVNPTNPNAGDAQASGKGSIAIGDYAVASGEQSVSIGQNSKVTGHQSTAVGKANQVAGDRSGAFGDPNIVSGNESYAIGNDNTIKGDKTFVLGSNVNTEAKNAVVLGHNSASNRDNTVSVGDKDAERQIIHVAAGTEATDAVNLQQMQDSNKETLKHAQTYTDLQVKTIESTFREYKRETEMRFAEVDERFDRQGAMSAAMMNMALSTAGLKGQNRIGVGAGFQGDEQAISIGYQRLVNENTSLSLSGALTDAEKSAGIGVGFSW